MVRGTKRTDSTMPATSSITMMPGSFWPRRRSTRPPAQMPARVDRERGEEAQGRERDEPERDEGDGAADGAGRHGRVAGAAARWRARAAQAGRRGPSAPHSPDQLVAVHFDDADLREAARREALVAEEHHPVDLGRLAGQPSLEGKRAVGARARPRARSGAVP